MKKSHRNDYSFNEDSTKQS